LGHGQVHREGSGVPQVERGVPPRHRVKDAKPQVTPVMYAMDGAAFVIAVDYGTKKLKNVRENPNVALVVDRLRPTRAVTVEGACQVPREGAEYRRLLNW